MIELTQELLEQLHAIQIEMLLEVKRICEKNKINYFLLGGTMLGAIRHKGYIPWDDDADIGMLREDYEKFRRVCKKDLNSDKYYFQDDRNTENYRWGYGKIRRKNTLFLRENQKHLNFGQEVFIDIFPLDYVSDSVLGRRIHMFHCFCIRKALWSPVGCIVDKNLLKRKIYKLLSKIPKSQIYSHYYRYINSRRPTNTVRLNLFPTRKPYGFPVMMFKDLIKVEFEKEEFCGMRDYDSYLKIKYGDYMKLPPVDQRKIHPVENIKLL